MIRKDVVYLAIIVVLLVIVAVLTCQSPPPDSAAAIYADSIKELKSQKAVISSRIDSVLDMSRNKEVDDSVKLAASLKEIARLKVNANKAVETIPVRVIEENPEIMIAIQAKDSVITKQGTVIDSLQASLAFQIQVKDDLMTDHYNAAKIDAQLQEMAQIRIIALEKDLRKERRKGRLAKVLIPIALVGGFLLGQ